jgi:hypothetical protein
MKTTEAGPEIRAGDAPAAHATLARMKMAIRVQAVGKDGGESAHFALQLGRLSAAVGEAVRTFEEAVRKAQQDHVLRDEKGRPVPLIVDGKHVGYEPTDQLALASAIFALSTRMVPLAINPADRVTLAQFTSIPNPVKVFGADGKETTIALNAADLDALGPLLVVEDGETAPAAAAA